MANIAEGFNRFRTAEFCQFLSIAKGSCGETQSHLYAALDAGFISQDRFDQIYDQAQTVMGLVTRLRAAIRQRDFTGFRSRKPPTPLVPADGTKHQALSTKHQAPSTKHQAPSTKH
jgi:23S rRNA-intervening sequence protein